jgi:hypothetical protein
MVGEGIQSVRCALTVSRTPAHASGTDTCMASGRMCGWGLTSVGGRVNECKLTANTQHPPPPPTHDMDASQRGPGEVSSHWSRTRRTPPHPCMRYWRTCACERSHATGGNETKSSTPQLKWDGRDRDDEHMHTHTCTRITSINEHTRSQVVRPTTRWLERWMVRGWGLEVGAHAAWLLIWVLMLGVCPWTQCGDGRHHAPKLDCNPVLVYGCAFSHAQRSYRTSACVHHASRRATMKVVW